MAFPSLSTLSPVIRFPNYGEFTDLNSFSIIIQDLSAIYDVTTIAVRPDYGQVLMPTTRIGPRRYSPLRQRDRLRVKRVSLASPLELAIFVAASTPALLSLKTFLEALSKGTDIVARIQVLNENRALGRERLRAAQLQNDILAEGLRRIRAETDVAVRAAEERLSFGQDPFDESPEPRGRHRAPARELPTEDYAQLLEEPIQRVFSYGGEELEIAGDDSASFRI